MMFGEGFHKLIDRVNQIRVDGRCKHVQHQDRPVPIEITSDELIFMENFEPDNQENNQENNNQENIPKPIEINYDKGSPCRIEIIETEINSEDEFK